MKRVEDGLPEIEGKYLCWIIDKRGKGSGHFWITEYHPDDGWHLANHVVLRWAFLPWDKVGAA